MMNEEKQRQLILWGLLGFLVVMVVIIVAAAVGGG